VYNTRARTRLLVQAEKQTGTALFAPSIAELMDHQRSSATVSAREDEPVPGA
jgi:hypothetical protein